MFKVIDNSFAGLSRRLLDMAIVAGAAELVSRSFFRVGLHELVHTYSLLVYASAILTFFTFSKVDLYASWRGRSMPSMCARVTTSWVSVLVIGILFSFAIHRAGELSRLWVLGWFVTSLALLIMHRVAGYYVLRFMRSHLGLHTKNVLIIGYGLLGREMHQRALQQDWFGYNVKAIFANAEELQQVTNRQIATSENIEGVAAYVAKNDIHEIWITLPITDAARLARVQYLLRNILVDIRFIPDMSSLRVLSNRMADFMGVPAVDLNHPIRDGEGMVKEVFDKLIAIAALAMLAVPFAMIAVAIKCTSPGPVFFRQARHGLNGKKFWIYKFRTMQVHQEQGSNTLTQARAQDPRTTPFGRFMRRTSIDELPQFINVLIGDMSIVGPRPHAVQHNEKYEELLELYMLRHRVKPGITGWAQINGLRGETDTLDKMNKRVQFDLHYIQNWSLWLDLKIIGWTAVKGWTNKNAY